MSRVACTVCDQPASRKCTRCGQVFCNLHVRQGNPYFTFGVRGTSSGWYCDACWKKYGTLRSPTWVYVAVLLLFAFAGLIIVGAIITAGFIIFSPGFDLLQLLP